MSMLSVRNVSVQIDGKVLLDRVSFEVEKNESVAIVGRSGAGKTTLLHALIGILPPKAVVSGVIECGNAPVDLSLRGRVISLVPQDPAGALDPLWTIGSQMREALRAHRDCDRIESRKRSIAALKATGLPEPERTLNLRPHELSGGMKQRVVLAMALLHNPEILLIDEPTSSLDAIARAEVLELLASVKKRTKCALLLVTHDEAAAKQITSRSIEIDNGKIAAPVTESPRNEPVPREQPQLQEKVLITRDLSVWFKSHRVVDRITFDVKRGETVAIVGESGSGKSTLARLIASLIPPSDGSVQIDDEIIDITSTRSTQAMRKHVQLVLQDPYSSLDPRLSVAAIIAEPLRAQGLWDSEGNARVRSALQASGLDAKFLSRKPHTLSGGQRQRVAIARALVVRPRLLVLDEPTSALDIDVRDGLVSTIATLQRESKLACVFISHDLPTVRAVADRIAVMLDGRFVEIAQTDKIFSDPQHSYTRRLLAAGSGG